MITAFDAQEEERRVQKGRSLEHFAEWVKWDECMEQDRDWQKAIHQHNDTLFQFEIAATEDQLPTPSVLCCWGILTQEQALCKLCNAKQCFLKHVLSLCDTAREQGRLTWRHDSILLALFKCIRELKNKGRALHLAKLKRGFKRAACQIKFTSDKGNKINTATVEEKVPLFEQSDDWELIFDVNYEQGKQRKNSPFPAHITTTDKRPDGVMFSDKLKTVMWLELTSPWEDNLTDAYVRKKAKYNALETQCKSAGWTVIPNLRSRCSGTYQHDLGQDE